MPYTASTQVVGFTVTTAPPTCPEGSECIDALRCVEMGGRCVEGTTGCGGRAQNCCCTFKPPPAPPTPPEETRIPTLAIVIAGVTVAGIVGLALWRFLKGR
ncbi:MAG: hypothetical protein LM558_05035 [Thermosphaera sp.]|nr:hypothetical protein [Thermosphaera sp.]